MKGLPRSLARGMRSDDDDTGQEFTFLGGNSIKAIHSALQALGAIKASSVTALTDNSGGGTANGTIEAIGNVTPAAVGTNDAAQLAASVAANLTAVNALKEIAGQVQAINAVVPALGGALVDSLTGTAADKTIAAITVNGSGVGASMVGAPALVAWFTSMKDRIAQLRYHTNKICVACGVTPLVDSSGGTESRSLTVADVTVISGTATGADALTNAIVKQTDYNAKMQLLADAVKELATKLNACRSATGITMEIVAQ